MKRKIWAALAACTVAAVSIVGFAGAAAAEDTPPPIDEILPVEQITVEEPVLEPDPGPAARVAPLSVHLPICHSGSGAQWSYIAPDASGYNGHQHHDADIVGLTEAECLAKNTPAETVDVDYVTVAWLAGDAPPNHFTVPQTYLFSEDTDEPNLATLDDEIAAYLAQLPCGEEVDIQVDVYYDNATTDALIIGAILYGPSNPDEDLIPGGAGTAWKFVHLEADDCQVVLNRVCETYVNGGTSTDLNANGWVPFDTRANGHAEYVDGGLHIWTDDASSLAKIQWAKDVADFPLAQVGQFGADYDATFGVGPGVKIVVEFAPGVVGTLIWEQVYDVAGEQDLWLPESANPLILAPDNGGGYGSTRHGTVNEWLSVYPDAIVTAIQFGLGSGVHADGVLHSVTVGCAIYTFDEVEQPEQPEPTTEYTEWVDGEFECDDTEVEQTRTGVTTTYTVEVQEGGYVIVAHEGEPFTETQTRTLSESEIVDCPLPPAPPVERDLAFTGNEQVGNWAAAAAVLMGGGIVALLIGLAWRRRQVEPTE